MSINYGKHVQVVGSTTIRNHWYGVLRSFSLGYARSPPWGNWDSGVDSESKLPLWLPPRPYQAPTYPIFIFSVVQLFYHQSHDVGLSALLETCPRSSRKMPFTSFLSISDSSFRFGYCVSLVLYTLNFRNKTNLDFFSSVVAGNGDIFISKLSTNPPLNKSDSR